MTNPFATFRKNQKYWMAALVLVAIFAFVIAPVFDYAQSAIRGGNSDNSVAVRWKGGKLTLAELQTAVQRHSSLVRFMSEVATRVLEQGGRPGVPGFRLDPQTNQIVGLGIQYSSNPQDIVRTKLLAAHGEELGVEFDDNAVDQFVQAFVDDRLSSEEVETILREASGGQLSYFEVRELLKEELTAMVAQQAALSGIFTESQSQMSPITPPGQTFDDFMKLNQTVKVEAFPVFVDDYLEQVSGDPSESEIQAIYDAGASVPANPNSPDPGFLRLYQANIEFVEASLQDWIEREKEKLTEEQLRAEYERRVELGQLQVPVTTEADTESAADTSQDDATNDSATSIEDPSADSNDGNAEQSLDSGAQETTTNTAEDSAAEDDPTGDDSSSDATPDSNDQSLRRKENPATSDVRLVSYLQDEQSSDESTAEVAASESQQAEVETELDAGRVPPPVVQPPQLGESDDASQSSSDEPQMRTQTFEEARETIADSLARDAAIPALDEALTNLLDETMRPYYGKFRQYQAFKQSDLKDEKGEERQPPEPPNLKKLAEDAGLKFTETGLIDGMALAQTPFGQSNIRPDETGMTGSAANVMMTPTMELYRPTRSTYFDQAALQAGEIPEFLQYLSWKTEEQQAYVPELDEVREEIVDAWKRIQARQLAENAARDLAKKVSVSAPTEADGESEETPNAWAEALSDTEQALVVETDPFTWMNQMGEFITTSPVNKLDRAGGEFMRQAFSTPVGQVAVAPNANRNIYYVFRVTSKSPSDEELQARFEADPIKNGPKRIAFESSQRLFAGWLDNLQEEMGLEWQMNVGQFE